MYLEISALRIPKYWQIIILDKRNNVDIMLYFTEITQTLCTAKGKAGTAKCVHKSHFNIWISTLWKWQLIRDKNWRASIF